MTEEEPEYKWNFYNSLFFVITVVSTIGYGNLVPTTMFTRTFMIFYALIGIPINGIVMVTLGEYFGKSFKKLYIRWKNTRIERSSAKLGLIGQIILYSVPGFTFFIFLPSTIMSAFEGWDYDVAVYYSFVTLTTIGFGDYIAGVDNVHDFSPTVYNMYKVFLLVWVIGGLGYVVMILGFITQGMRHKRVVEIEKMLATNIIKTPQKIRDELRNILQEFLFMRVKPVYKEEFIYTPSPLDRTQSCPDLTLWRNLNSPSMIRKRAMSECCKHITLQRVQSDTDLERIDKEQTFKPSNALMQQKDLLLKVVDALGQVAAGNGEGGGIHGFSDREILASEGHEEFPPSFRPKRRRAVSDIRPPTTYDTPSINGFTWYGNDASKFCNEFGKQRQRTLSSPTVEKQDRLTLFQRLRNRFKVRDERNVDIEKQTLEEVRRPSILSSEGDIRSRRYSTLSTSQQEQVLEQTTIADFIRALSAIATPENKFEQEPKRKLGTASLTPPEIAPSRRRRLSIRPNLANRRASLIPPTVSHAGERRFSLRPVDENLLVSPPPYSLHPPEAKNTVQARRFSIRPVNITPSSNITSPVKRQVNKRERTDTENSSM
ncbi:hypothetical protein NQ317_014877 [Molorchus minor]|uniref:Potassium channel domain-containing protein n=1 Tax=Molorchus minor TaxID=1323400 RepID=A0ABQ9J4V7_9CUCU|nr:hypothetical protein NQ317_014877 [Molorchus minor]